MNLGQFVGKKYGIDVTEEQIRHVTGAKIIDVFPKKTNTDIAFMAGRVRIIVNQDLTITCLSHERDDGRFVRFSQGEW